VGANIFIILTTTSEDVQMFLVGNLFTIVAFHGQGRLGNHGELGGDAFVVGDAFRIDTPDNPLDLRRNFHYFLLCDDIVVDNVKLGVRSNQGNLVDFVIFKVFVANLYDCLASQFFTLQVGPEGDLVLDFVESQYGDYLEQVTGGDMIDDGAVSDGADFQLFLDNLFHG